MKVIIVGGGQVGAYIANTLSKSNIDVKVIENRPHVYEKLVKDSPKSIAVMGDGTSASILESCGILDADVLVAVTGADETNLVVATLAKFEYGVPRVIARVNNPKNEWLFTIYNGVDVGLNQARLMSRMVIEEMDFSTLLTLMNLGRSAYSIVQITVLIDSPAVGNPVKDLKLPQDSLLVSINRGNDVILPRGDVVIKNEDEIIALVHEKEHKAFTDYFQPNK
jgi:trk system potassium uptake protein TrkA